MQQRRKKKDQPKPKSYDELKAEHKAYWDARKHKA